MINIYVRFLINLFFKSFIQIFLIVTALILIISIFEEIEFFKKIDVHFLYPIFLSLLNTPTIVFDSMPFVFLISTQVFFIKLIDNNELQIFKYSGLTNTKILKIISLFSFFIGLILIIFFYNVSSKFKNYYLDLKNSFSNDDKYLAVITENGLWIKDEIDNKINIINASKIEGFFLNDVLISQFNNEFDYIRTINSEKVDITNNNWILFNVTISQDNISNFKDKMNHKSNFDLKRINSLFSNLSSLTLWELFKLKKSYKSLNYSTIEVDSHIYKIFSYPFYITIITIMSAIIMFNIKHQKSSIYKIIFGIFISVVIYYINNFFNILGINEKIPLTLSIWLPLILITIINFTFIVNLNEK